MRSGPISPLAGPRCNRHSGLSSLLELTTDSLAQTTKSVKRTHTGLSSVLITGSARGIGCATALELAHRGHRVVATDRDVAPLAGLPVDLRLELDVSDGDSVARAARRAGEVDVLVSNAGVIFVSPIETTPPDELERLLRQNTVGAMRIAQALLPPMRERGSGRLLFVSSVLGRMTLATRGAYAASKWALEALVETLAIEIAPFGVQVALLEPGPVASGALDAPLRYFGTDGVYEPLDAQIASARGSTISVAEAAEAIADAVEAVHLPLRIPVGAPARRALAARRQAGDDAPFLLAPIAW